jgi:ATP-binding protein involved in chromosome partitioning
VRAVIELTTPACPVKEQLKQQCEDVIRAVDGVTDVSVEMTAQVRESGVFGQKMKIPGVKNVIAVASGKGGVGKSTTAVNLAAALRVLGARVGILDADIYGPSVPMMMGLLDRPRTDQQNHIYPLEAYGVQFMSMGLLTDENTPVIWRGPMVGGIIQQFLSQVMWDNLDYLVIDLPPGTGDAQLTLCQRAPLSGAVIVTTPQEVSLLDARKGLKMFEKVQVPVLGIVENMSYFICGQCSTEHDIFKRGGGKHLAKTCGVPFLGDVPIETAICQGGDTGRPIVFDKPDSASAKAYIEIAKRTAAEVSTRQLSQPSPDPSKLTLNWKN